jgi:hypothetical protein
LFSERATTISIVDEDAGEFVEVSQSPDNQDAGKITIDKDEWPSIRDAIECLLRQCREVHE